MSSERTRDLLALWGMSLQPDDDEDEDAAAAETQTPAAASSMQSSYSPQVVGELAAVLELLQVKWFPIMKSWLREVWQWVKGC